MERDFLGLNSKNNVAMAFKEQFPDPSKNSGMQWSFSNKVSALPQLLSFKAAQDDKQRKMNVDSSDTSNLTIHRPYSSVIQKNVATDKKAANQYAMAVYPYQNAEAISVHPSQDVKVFSISNQPNNANAVPLAFNVPVFQSQLVSSGQNVLGSNVNLQPFGGVPIATSISVPFTSSVVGTTELRNASKPPGSMAQLTVFYAGSVCVYNDISPEKAQAIMLLASSSVLPQTQNNIISTGQVKTSFPTENFQGIPLLGLSNPLPAVHSKALNAALGSSNNIELPTAKPIQTSASHPNCSEPPKDACSVASISPIAPTFVPAAVPQARKASLARFLEKRKERINTCPYILSKKTSDCSSTTLDLMA